MRDEILELNTVELPGNCHIAVNHQIFVKWTDPRPFELLRRY